MSKKNIISFLNMKGGVCKTTLCKEMAQYISHKYGEKVLVIDIDPQANCTQSFFEKYNIINIDDDTDDDREVMVEKPELPSIQNIFIKSKDGLNGVKMDKIICKLTDKLHLIPGDLDTVFMERETANGGAEQRLFNFIDECSLKNDYKYIFIDCPPTYSFYTVSALLVSDYYFVPLVPDIYSLLGLDLLERVVSDLKDVYRIVFQNHSLTNLGVIFSKVPKNPNNKMSNNINSIKNNFSDLYFFENNFLRADKLGTNKLSTFITDRVDSGIKENLDSICTEFMYRVANSNDNG